MHALSKEEFMQQQASGQLAATLSYERYLVLQERRAARARRELKTLAPADRAALKQLANPKAPSRRAA